MKSRTKPSAFFRILAGAAIGAAGALILFAVELLAFGLAPQLSRVWTYSVLWILPSLFFAGIFLHVYVRRNFFRLCLWVFLCLILAMGSMYFVINPPAQLYQLGYIRQRLKDIPVDNIEGLDQIAAKPLKIYMQDAKEMDPDAQEWIISFVSSLDPALLARPSGLYFLNLDSFSKEMGEDFTSGVFGYSQNMSRQAFIRMPSDSEQNRYTVFKDGSHVDLSEPDFYTETIVHELCHLLDVQEQGDTLFFSRSPEWQNLYDQYSQLLGEYGATSPVEFFAEAGVYYFLYPDLLQDISPEIYDAFDKCIQNLRLLETR